MLARYSVLLVCQFLLVITVRLHLLLNARLTPRSGSEKQ